MAEKNVGSFNKIISVVSFLAQLVTIFTAIYGLWFVVPNFIKQKRLENFSNNSAKALEFVIELEESFRELILITKKPCNETDHLKVQLRISYALNNLRTRLLFLRTFPEISNLIPWIDSLRKTFNNIFESEDACQSGSNEAISEFKKYWKSNSEITIKRIEELRNALLNIFEIKEKEHISKF